MDIAGELWLILRSLQAMAHFMWRAVPNNSGKAPSWRHNDHHFLSLLCIVDSADKGLSSGAHVCPRKFLPNLGSIEL